MAWWAGNKGRRHFARQRVSQAYADRCRNRAMGRSPKMRDTIVFDLDGTIADTAGDLIAAANAALARMGHGPALRPGDDDATAFRGGRAMLELGVRRGWACPIMRASSRMGTRSSWKPTGRPSIRAHDALPRCRGGGRRLRAGGGDGDLHQQARGAGHRPGRPAGALAPVRRAGRVPTRCRCASLTPRPFCAPWTAAGGAGAVAPDRGHGHGPQDGRGGGCALRARHLRPDSGARSPTLGPRPCSITTTTSIA
jgi:hypothetical protein